jgi:putative phage-type endonuclease
MNRQTHNLQQGSQAWHDFRAKHFGASELSAAAGASKYTTRADLVKEKATGISKEIDARTQALFDKGHAAEESARGIAEEIIGEELSPMVMSLEIDGIPLSASLDGIVFDKSIIFEHKLYSESLAAQVQSGTLDQHYTMQLAQQILVSGSSKALFMTSDGTKENMAYCWYTPTQDELDHVVSTWKQFAADLAAYVPTEIKEAPKAEAIIALPSVFVQATGMVTASNLTEFKEAATSFIANIKTELISDDDFANAEATVKFCKDAEVNLESTKASVLAQMSTVDEVVRTLDHIKKQLADKRLMLDKLVKSEKESRKAAIVDKARIAFNEYFVALEEEIKPVRLIAQHPDFGGAMKGLKKLSAMQEAVDTALRDGKFAAEQVAKDVRAKLAWCKESSAGFGFLFSDLSSLIANNGMEAFQAIVNGRIAQHKADEAAKEEATRLRIQAEEEAKAQAKAKAEQDAIVAKAIAEQKAIDAAAQHQYEKALAGENDVLQAAQVQRGKSEEATHAEGKRDPMPQAPSASTPPISATIRASRAEILEVLAENFGRPEEVMLDWIIAEFAGDIQFEGRKAA